MRDMPGTVSVYIHYLPTPFVHRVSGQTSARNVYVFAFARRNSKLGLCRSTRYSRYFSILNLKPNVLEIGTLRAEISQCLKSVP